MLKGDEILSLEFSVYHGTYLGQASQAGLLMDWESGLDMNSKPSSTFVSFHSMGRTNG